MLNSLVHLRREIEILKNDEDVDVRELDKIFGEIACEVTDKCIELPKDANGEVIHVGDNMTDGEYRFEVFSLSLTQRDHFNNCWTVENERGAAWACVDVSHHKPPTTEDVLREFVDEFNRDDTELCDEEIIEMFAKKLQLKEES